MRGATSKGTWLGVFCAAAAAADTITFDELGTQPCTFSGTSALREQYAGRGVHFTGGATLDGGAILDQCGGFGANARSGSNFLAFNRGTNYPGGGLARDPQVITFDVLQKRVSIWASAGNNAGVYSMIAYDQQGNVIDSFTAGSSGPDYLELSIASPSKNIARVELRQAGSDNAWVFDDLTFEGGLGCTGDEDLKKASCKKGKLKVKTIGGTPASIVTVSTACGSGSGTVKANGSAAVKISPCAGSGTATARWTCGATDSGSYNCADDRGSREGHFKVSTPSNVIEGEVVE